MPALKSTCPECNLTFDAPASSGLVMCPICDTEFPAPTSVKPAATMQRQPAPTPLAAPAPARPPIRRASVPKPPARGNAGSRNLVVKALIAGGLLFLVAGAGMAYYVFSALNKPKAGNENGPQASTTPAESPGDQPAPPVVQPQPLQPPPMPTPMPPVRRELSAHEKRVNTAIDKGVRFLKKELFTILGGNRSFRYNWHKDGVIGLIGLTLLECGVPADDPTIKRAAQHLRSRAPDLLRTYPLSLTILFLERLGNPQDNDVIQSCALRLVAGQQEPGCWTYECRALTSAEETKLIDYLGSVVYRDPDEPSVKPLTVNLPEKLRELAVPRWQAGRKPRSDRGDHSNTQFAVLALWVAQRQGLPMQPVLALVDRYFRTMQNNDGSFGYIGRRQWHDSMTCSGLLGLAVGRSVGVKPGAGERRRDPAIEKALKFLVGRIDGKPYRASNGKLIKADSYGDLYYLWSLERVAVIFDLDTIGGKDWYAWASKVIVDNQEKDGSWKDSFPATVDTCFALLVLKRANVAKDLTTNIKKLVDIKSAR